MVKMDLTKMKPIKIEADLTEVFRPLQLHGIALEAIEEIRRARKKHGSNADLPDGTGPEKHVLHHLASWSGGSNREMPITNAELEQGAKARTDECHNRGVKTREMILTEEWAEAMAESDVDALRGELIQLIAMGIDWVCDIDRRERDL